MNKMCLFCILAIAGALAFATTAVDAKTTKTKPVVQQPQRCGYVGQRNGVRGFLNQQGRGCF